MNDVVVVGAGYAGVSCALRLSSRITRLGLPVRVRLVSPRPVLAERIRLDQFVTGQALPERTLGSLLAGSKVDLIHGTAEAIDPDARTVRVDGRDIGWDRLVLAGGSGTDLHSVPGADEHAVTLDYDSAPGVMQKIAALPHGARVAVIGGGLSGIEVASEVAEACWYLDVDLVSCQRVGGELSPAGRAHVLHVLGQRLGVAIYENQQILSVGKRVLRTASGELHFDLCIWTAGLVAPPLLREAGLSTNAKGQVLVDPMLRSVSAPHVYVAGDIGVPVIPTGQQLPKGCKSAMPMGAHVAENIICELRGKPARKFDFALMFYCVSLGRRNGLILRPDAAGRPVGRVLSGHAAVLFKEFICRSTMWAIRLERRGIPAVAWRHTGKVHGHAGQLEGLGQ
ncbi:MAG: NAD(P)/FAD-dependent oxidoreductase [Telluria sp.]